MEETVERKTGIWGAFLVMGIFGMFSNGCSGREIAYPEAERGSQVDTYHGVEVPDPYRWLEDLDSEATARWVEAENAIARPYLDGISAREAIEKRLAELWSYERYGLPFKEGGKVFYTRNDGLQDQDVLYVADSLEGEPKELIDPNGFSEDATISLAAYSVSPDGRVIAYGVSDGGTDWKTWKVRDVETAEDFPDDLRFLKFSDASWARDSSGFYYSRYPEGPDGDGDGSAAVSCYYHSVGTAQSEDVLVYSLPDRPTQNPYATVTEDGRYLIFTVREGYTANAIHYKSLSSPDSEVNRLLDEWDGLYEFRGNEGAVFFLETTKEAPRSRIVAIDVTQPADWREVVPEAAETLVGASYIGGRFVARYLKDAHAVVKVFDVEGSLVRHVDLPGIGSVEGFSGHADAPETFYAFTSYTTPRTIHRYDVETGEESLFRRPDIDVDFDAYETEQVFFTSKDGTRVPMFITHRKGMERNGGNPTLLYGYGGFNISLTPSYQTSYMVWLEMGGVLAIPNLRGGGEYGEEWHIAGTKLDKQNVFDDFIAAAEWLIADNITSTPKLAIRGASNGGLLVGAAMTQRPELFGAVHAAVGVLDMLRYHLPSANARQWSSDYGLSEVEEEFQALYAYSPYHNIEEGACYPPALITTADHDDRVVPWHSFKFGAALQNGQKCDSPILVRVETRAGHGAGKPRWMQIEEIADQWAFFADVLSLR